MKTLVSTALAGAATASTLTEALARGLEGAPPRLAVVFASPKHDLGALAGGLASSFPGAVVVGATTAGEFTDAGDAKSSIAAFALAGDYVAHAGHATGIAENPEAALTRALDGLPRVVRGYPCCTCILLIDPLAGVSEELTLLASALLGEGVPIVGGAAGDDLAMKETRVASGSFVASDAVVVTLLFSKVPLGIGVAHGHRALAGPFRVTRAEGNVVHELDGRPAWDVWRERTRDAANAAGFADPLPDADVGAYLLRFEGGLDVGDGAGDALKIRAPLTRAADGSLGFACGVAQGSSLYITESDVPRQVVAAREAAERAREALGAARPAGALVFDCICRNLIVGAGFGEVVGAISSALGGVPIAGFETYGEIAMQEGQLSGFHNTTSVVLAFPVGE